MQPSSHCPHCSALLPYGALRCGSCGFVSPLGVDAQTREFGERAQGLRAKIARIRRPMLVAGVCLFALVVAAVVRSLGPRDDFEAMQEGERDAREGRLSEVQARLKGKREASALDAKVACDMIHEYLLQQGHGGERDHLGKVTCDGVLTINDQRGQFPDIRFSYYNKHFTVTACIDRRSRWYVLDVLDSGSCADLPPTAQFTARAAQLSEAEVAADEQQVRDALVVTAFRNKLSRIKVNIAAERGSERHCSGTDLAKYMSGVPFRNVATVDIDVWNDGGPGVTQWDFLTTPVIDEIMRDMGTIEDRAKRIRALRGPGGTLLVVVKGEEKAWPVVRKLNYNVEKKSFSGDFDAGKFKGWLFVYDIDAGARLCQTSLAFRNNDTIYGGTAATALLADLMKNYSETVDTQIADAAPGLKVIR